MLPESAVVTGRSIVALGLALAIGLSTSHSGAAVPIAPTDGFLTAQRAGFRHAALLYDESRTDVARHVALRRDGRPVRDGWLFDAFVHLTAAARSGERTDYGRTTAADWSALLQRWFGRQSGAQRSRTGAAHQLDAAITATAAETADDGQPMGQPPQPRQLIVAMPWPSPAQRAFGTIDGHSADLSDPAQRLRVVSWYVREVRAAYDAAGLRQLHLWGIYLMREDAVGPDLAWQQQAVALIEAAGLRALWIPYWGAPGTPLTGPACAQNQQRRSPVFIQPSYAFTSPLDGGRVGAARLASAAAAAARCGLGVEVEVRGGAVGTDNRRLLRQYLAAGTRLGYQQASTAWFLGGRPTPFDPLPDGSDNPAYLDIADYIRGRPVADEDVHAELVTGHTADDRPTATIEFTATSQLRALRIDFQPSPVDRPWTGVVSVQARTPQDWVPAGWAARRLPEPGDEEHPSMLVPLAELAGVSALRAVFDSQLGDPPRLAAMVADTSWRLAPTPPASPWLLAQPARYPDRPPTTELGLAAGKLTNGRWSVAQWHSGEQVGWQLQSGDLAVIVDLGAAHPVEQVVLHTHASTEAGVTWPVAPLALLATSCPARIDAATGAPACPVRVVPGTNVPPTQRPGVGSDSHALRLVAPPGSVARWVTVVVSGHGWIMLDEIEVRSGGRNVARNAPYHIAPPATRVFTSGQPASRRLSGVN